MRVRFRDGTKPGETLAYFIDSRRLLGVNLTGRFILDRLFNDGIDRDIVERELCATHHLDNESVHDDVGAFLTSVDAELDTTKYNAPQVGPLSSPLGVELEITPACNLRCAHCLQHHYTAHYIPLHQATGIMKQLVDAGLCEVSVIGGEPLFHPNAKEIITLCAEEFELATSVITNGTLIDENCATWMSKLARLAVFVSLDGTESIHDRIRGSGTFAKANDALRMLINAGVSADVLFTLNALNAQCYREVLDYCRELGVTCNFNLFKPFRRKQGGLVISPTRFFEIALDLFELRQRGSYAIGIANAAIVSKLLGGPVRNECRACEAGLVITAFGKMVTCPALVEAGYYHAEDLPEFDANFLQTWKSHRIFAEFRGNGLRGCQLRSVIFCKNPKRPDPYGIEAFTNFLDKKFPGDSIRATSYSAPNRERSRSFSE